MTEENVKMNVDIQKILEICREIEVYTTKLYQYFADIYSDTTEIAALW